MPLDPLFYIIALAYVFTLVWLVGLRQHAKLKKDIRTHLASAHTQEANMRGIVEKAEIQGERDMQLAKMRALEEAAMLESVGEKDHADRIRAIWSKVGAIH